VFSRYPTCLLPEDYHYLIHCLNANDGCYFEIGNEYLSSDSHFLTSVLGTALLNYTINCNCSPFPNMLLVPHSSRYSTTQHLNKSNCSPLLQSTRYGVFVINGSPDFHFFYSIWRGTLQLTSLTPPREQIAIFTEMSFGANLLLSL
jgi:hypothetical protein